MRTRRALVTGATRGIGLAIAKQLARDGYDLTLSARDQDALETVAIALRESGRRVSVVPADMARPDQVESLADAQLESGDPLDVLVVAAGVGTAGSLAEYPVRRLDTQFAVNVRAPFMLIQHLLPALHASADESRAGSARIIAIASITGVVSEPDLAAYGATKAAMISLCESITVAEGKNGVCATSICPGYVDTDMTAWIRDRIDPENMIQPQDIAEIVSAVCRLSRHAVIPNVVLTRPGPQLWRA